MENNTLPIVMAIAGNDPTGGAGLTADIEAIISQGCHAVPVVSCVTVQDTCDVSSINPIDSELLLRQARAVLEDLPVDVIKIGLLGSEENIEAVHEILADYPDIPVIMDPILSAGGGALLSNDSIIDAMSELLFPYVHILTPNTQEALRLIPGADSIQAAALGLQEQGCSFVLVTGTHQNTEQVINRLFGEQREIEQYYWERLPHTYHGSGCTLSSALAGLIAQRVEILDAMKQAQDYTWRSLQSGYRLGMGQHHPNRLFWAGYDEEELEAGAGDGRLPDDYIDADATP